MLWALLFLFAGQLAAQAAAPAFFRGDFVRMKSKNEFVVRTTEGAVHECQFDEKTWFESGQMRLNPSSLEAGEHLEVVSDSSRETPGGCYARTVHVVALVTPVRSRIRPYQSVTEHIAPRGDLSYGGVVTSVEGTQLVMHLRSQSEPLTLTLRPDTRYVHEGIQVEASELKRNERIYVRAGKSLGGQVEAYQISWGEILKPMKP